MQTDTTVGFVSQNAAALAACKERPPSKPFLKTFASWGDYTKTGRIPARFRREARRAEKTTFIVKNAAFRVVPEGPYHALLRPYGWLYSTSANASGQRYDARYAFERASVIVEGGRGLFEDVPSAIYRLNHQVKRRIR